MTEHPASNRTSIGGPSASFPITHWSILCDAPRPETKGRRQAALEELARSYWKPVYVYVSLRWKKSNEEAKDLTQDFFAWALESGLFDKADPRRGRFRTFLKLALENFLIDGHRRAHTQKQGGGRKLVSFEDDESWQLPDPSGKTPDQVLDEVWTSQLLARAMHRLEKELSSEGREVVFRIFRDFYLQKAEGTDYDGLATRYGVTRSEVANGLVLAKDRLRVITSDLVAETVSNPEELRQELVELFGSA